MGSIDKIKHDQNLTDEIFLTQISQSTVTDLSFIVPQEKTHLESLESSLETHWVVQRETNIQTYKQTYKVFTDKTILATRCLPWTVHGVC